MAKQALPRPNRIDIAAACKEAGLIAFVTLVLALPMAGFETVGATEGLALNFRPWLSLKQLCRAICPRAF